MGSKDYAFKTLPDGKKILATAYWAEKQKGKISAIGMTHLCEQPACADQR